MAAAKALDFYSKEAKERQREAGGDRKSEDYQKSVTANLQEAINNGEAAEKAGKVFDVSKNTDDDFKLFKLID